MPSDVDRPASPPEAPATHLDALEQGITAIETWLRAGADPASLPDPELPRPPAGVALQTGERAWAAALVTRLQDCLNGLGDVAEDIRTELLTAGERRTAARRYLVHEPDEPAAGALLPAASADRFDD